LLGHHGKSKLRLNNINFGKAIGVNGTPNIIIGAVAQLSRLVYQPAQALLLALKAGTGKLKTLVKARYACFLTYQFALQARSKKGDSSITQPFHLLAPLSVDSRVYGQ